MKNTLSYDLNRPVHLARRDVFLERAHEMIQKCVKETTNLKCLQQLNASLYYLNAVLEHSSMAAGSNKALPNEKSLILRVKNLIFQMLLIITLQENEADLKCAGSQIEEPEGKKNKPHRKKQGNCNCKQLFDDISVLFSSAELECLMLKNAILDSMNEHEKEQYDNARHELQKHVATKHHQRHAITHARTFCSVLAGKYE